VARRLARPGDRPEDGAVTAKVAEAELPESTFPSDTLPDGETVHADDGAASETEAPVSGAEPGLASVALTVNVPSASAVEPMAARVGCGLAGGPYTSGE
jgi:hypothetical protein